MCIEIKLIANSYNRKVLDDFLNSGVRKGDLILFINNDREYPLGPLLAEFSEPSLAEFSEITSGGPDYLTFKAGKAVFINNLLEIGGLVFPQGTNVVKKNMRYIPDKVYVGDEEKIHKALESEKLIGYKH